MFWAKAEATLKDITKCFLLCKISGVALTVFLRVFNFIALLQSYFSTHVGMCLAETESLAGFQSLV